ncbi:MauE/DoxX family redox-associated membrane protein [Nocardia sp. NPDC051570]|uniref:MauE/DoxX family redox-associated membrane protein n=1 Tax=Nocardia sp. NPDC051570 TaxID=3364324 RepID=UPI003796450C
MSELLGCVTVAAVGVVFVLAAVSKLGATARIEFAAAVTGLVPAARGGSTGIRVTAVIVTEWVIVVLLVIPGPVMTVAGFGLAALTLAAFTTALTAAPPRRVAASAPPPTRSHTFSSPATSCCSPSP